MRVLIVRHGIAVERGQPGSEKDEERPLTPKGVRRVRAAAGGIARLLPELDAIYTSPLVRAVETAQLLAESYGGRPRPEVADELAPKSSAAATARWLRELPSAEAVALVGHEPSCSELVSYLLVGHSRVGVEFKKGGAALLDVEANGERLRGALLWHAPPRMLRLAR